MVARFAVLGYAAGIDREPTFGNQARNDVVNLEGDAMTMCFPIGARVAQESSSFFVRKRFPDILSHWAKRIDHRAPINALVGRGSSLIANQVHQPANISGRALMPKLRP